MFALTRLVAAVAFSGASSVERGMALAFERKLTRSRYGSFLGRLMERHPSLADDLLFQSWRLA